MLTELLYNVGKVTSIAQISNLIMSKMETKEMGWNEIKLLYSITWIFYDKQKNYVIPLFGKYKE